MQAACVDTSPQPLRCRAERPHGNGSFAVRNHFVDAFAELLERERLTTWLVPEPAPDLALPLLAEPAFIILELEVLGQRSYELACKLRSLLFGQLGRDEMTRSRNAQKRALTPQIALTR
jgi:hypothetical protein